MVTINKTYEKIAPKLDDMVRRGFSDIELKYGARTKSTPTGKGNYQQRISASSTLKR